MQYSRKFFQRSLLVKLLFSILCCAALFAGMSGVSFASSMQSVASAPSFSLQPVSSDSSKPATQSYFVINARQGTLVQEQIRVTNVGKAEGTVKLFPVDTQTGETGGIIYLSQAQHDIGSWITLAAQQLTLSPGQSQVVPFQIAIPQKVRPGPHIGGIAALGAVQQGSTTTINKSHFQINTQQQAIIAVELNLPGPQTEQLVATGIQAGGQNGYQQLLVGLSNTGTLMINGYGSLQVRDANGTQLRNLNVNFGTFLPQTNITYPASVQGKALGIGTYQAMLTLHYGRNNALNNVLYYQTTFTITQDQLKQTFPNIPLQAPSPINSFLPLWAIILIGVLAVLVIAGGSGLIFWRLGRRVATDTRRLKR